MTSQELRRAIHRHPELSFEEYATQQLIIDALEAEGIDYRKIAGTGVQLQLVHGWRRHTGMAGLYPYCHIRRRASIVFLPAN